MLGTKLDVQAFLERACQEIRRINPAEVKALADAIYECYQRGRMVFLCGNGGSGSNASHFCEDAGKNTLRREDYTNDNARRLRILSLTDNTPNILAWGNDEGFDRVFVEQLKNLASPGDLLIAISGSGNSPNILGAVDWANAQGLVTWGITGYSGGKLLERATRSLHVPLADMGLVESVHLVVFHWVLNDLYARINRVGRHADSQKVKPRVFEGT